MTKASRRSSQADDRNWAVIECADAALGDVRRPKRLVDLAGVLAQHPTAALPAAGGEGAMRNAASGFLDNDASEPPDVLLSPLEAPDSRLSTVPLVWAAQDPTAVDWTAHPATTGLGPLGPTACQGLLVHRTRACTPERRPVGRLAQQGWARDPDDVGKRARRKPRPISPQESQKWRASLDAVCRAGEVCPQTCVVRIGAREADVYDRRAAPRPAGVERLIRASWDRWVSAPQRDVWATVDAQPVMEQLRLPGPRRGAQPAREALLALRGCPVTRCPPRYRTAEGWPAVVLWAVQVRAVAPPAEGQPIEWRLLTTVAVHSVEDARERVHWYACRWGLELGPRLLTRGGRIEARQLATDERLERGLTRDRVMAWRVVYAIMRARAVPEMPCDVLLDIAEWPALYGAIHHCATPPESPPSLGEAVRWIAPLGGFGGRRRRDQPEAETWWRGL